MTMVTSDVKFKVWVFRGKGEKYQQDYFGVEVPNREEVVRVMLERATGLDADGNNSDGRSKVWVYRGRGEKSATGLTHMAAAGNESAGMLDPQQRQTQEQVANELYPPGQRVIWYFHHGDFRKDNPDGLAMAEINLP
jgi:hypothetical protein